MDIDITRQPVQSGNIHSIGYHADSQTLEVKFRNGKVYRYESVPRETYERLMAASSIGSELNASIKPFFKCVPMPLATETPAITAA